MVHSTIKKFNSTFNLSEYACTREENCLSGVVTFSKTGINLTPKGNRRGRIKIESKSFGTAVLYGLIFIFLFAALSSLIFSFVLRFTSIREVSLQYIITAISFIGLFGGGFLSGGKSKQKGWLIGGLTGLIYSLIVFLFQYLGYDRLFTPEQFIYHICYILIAMMGGILGVNMSTTNSRTV